MHINWKIRFSKQNVLYMTQLILAVITPVLAYFGLTGKDFTTWSAVLHTLLMAVQNPYVVMLMLLSWFNATTDPTTKGIKDSNLALTYRYLSQPKIISTDRRWHHE